MQRWLLFFAALTLFGQQPRPLEPREPNEYAASAKLDDLTLAADYLVRSFGGDGAMYFARDYLVVEVAVLPKKGGGPEISPGHFFLRINGKKPELTAQPANFVAAALKYPDWEQRPELVAQGGVGDRTVIVGRQPQTERFPGDQRPQQQRLPRPPRAPDAADRSGVERQPAVPPEEFALQQALNAGIVKGPVAGYLYFHWRGNPKKIRKVDLLYKGPAGEATLNLLDR